MSAIKSWLKKELRELIPVTIYFLLAFELLALTQTLMLAEHGGGAPAYIGAAVGALLVAKVVIIIDHLRFMRRFQDRPLLHAIVWSTLVYFVVSTLVRYAEHIVRLWGPSGGFVEANRKLLDHGTWSRAALVHLWLFVILAVFCAFRAITRATGSNDLLELLLKRRTARLQASKGSAASAARRNGD